jgi:hypothetical protein
MEVSADHDNNYYDKIIRDTYKNDMLKLLDLFMWYRYALFYR